MGILDRIFNRGGSDTEEPATELEDLTPKECLHVGLVPQWDNLDDMGKEDKASRWECGSCNQSFTPEQAQELKATEAQRIRGEASTSP